jgi:AcrR family transcriptional regulator
MPTSTFYNLPAEKREKLINAIKDEFMRVPFDEVSINKIVHTAEIPRGSFYQYFTGKNDVLEFILADFRQRIIVNLKEYLTMHNGDIFGMFYEILEYTTGFVLEESGNNFYKNIFADIKVNTEFYLKMPHANNESEEIKELRPFINTDVLDLREESDYENMLQVLMAVSGHAIAEVFFNLADCEDIKLNYKKRLELLKRGFIKEKE